MIRVSVGNSYEDFKRVVGALGKAPVVFWARENPTHVNMWALSEGAYLVHTSFEVAPPATPLSPTSLVEPGPFSPLAPPPVGATPPLSGPGVAAATPPTKGQVLTLGSLRGGSNYTPGTYPAMPTTGGSGSGLTVDLVVGAGGAVDSVSVHDDGKNYVVGDVIKSALGSGSGFQATVATVSASVAGTPGAPAAPKTVLETDFPGAIELPGGAVVFS
jgi:hypothetical protein